MIHGLTRPHGWCVGGLLLAACLGPSSARPVPARAAKTPVSAAVYQAPLARMEVLSRFGPRGRRMHEGIDLRQSRAGGDPVMAAAAGVVVEAGWMRGYGREILLRHADGWHTRYGHLRSFKVKKGQTVKAGEVLGTTGATGRASTPHLHFEILTPGRRHVDPAPYIFKK
jgi:murein DD-endopeptidase MepM/ murein hydrolase activator NlpD